MTIVWTRELVEERLAEAADVLKRLPEARIQGYFSTWPRVLSEFVDLAGQEPKPMRRPPPSSQAMTRWNRTRRCCDVSHLEMTAA